MKKTIATLILAGVGIGASAGEVTLGVANDSSVSRAGSRVTIAADKPVVGSVVPFVSGTFTNQYARLAAGGEVGLFNAGPVKVSGTVAGVHQRTESGSNGNGVAAGVRATYPLSKTMNVVVGVESFNGNSKIDRFDGTVTTVGVSTRF